MFVMVFVLFVRHHSMSNRLRVTTFNQFQYHRGGSKILKKFTFNPTAYFARLPFLTHFKSPSVLLKLLLHSFIGIYMLFWKREEPDFTTKIQTVLQFLEASPPDRHLPNWIDMECFYLFAKWSVMYTR